MVKGPALRLLTVGLAAVLVVGCGGRKRSAPPLSHATFVTDADRICAGARTRGTRLAQLQALHPPARDGDLFSHWLAAERDARAAAAALAEGAEVGRLDPSVALAIAEGKVAGYARRLGALSCAKRTTGTMPP